MSFDGEYVEEKNPLWRGVWRRSEFPALFIGAQCAAANAIEKSPNKDTLYALWAIAQMAFVWHNRRLTGFGIPVLSVRF